MTALRTLLPFAKMFYSDGMPANDTDFQRNEFLEEWRGLFGPCPPLGHVLRQDYFDIWTRFHALPESKRYPEDDEEVGIILERANALATDCFGECACVWIVAASFTDLAPKSDDLPSRLNMMKAMVWIDHGEKSEDQSEVSFFASRLEWQRGCLDALLREIVDDQERAVLFSKEAQTVFAPYDGGFDIISAQPGKIDQLENTYRTWMSSRPDKL